MHLVSKHRNKLRSTWQMVVFPGMSLDALEAREEVDRAARAVAKEVRRVEAREAAREAAPQKT
jgi:hypothetical protein